MSGVAHQEVTVDAVSAVLPGVSPGGMSMDTLVEDGYCVTSAKEVEDFTQSPHAEQEGKVSASGISEHEVAMAATSAVFPGVSLTGTTTHALLHDGYRVTCAIEVENWTRFRLTDPHVQLNGGVLTVAPSSIVPAAREVMVSVGWTKTLASYFSCSKIFYCLLLSVSLFSFICTFSSSLL